MPVPGPFTLAGCIDGGDVYRDRDAVTEALIPIVNAELKALRRRRDRLPPARRAELRLPPRRARALPRRHRADGRGRRRLHQHAHVLRQLPGAGRRLAVVSARSSRTSAGRRSISSPWSSPAGRWPRSSCWRELPESMDVAVGLIDVKNTWIEPAGAGRRAAADGPEIRRRRARLGDARLRLLADGAARRGGQGEGDGRGGAPRPQGTRRGLMQDRPAAPHRTDRTGFARFTVLVSYWRCCHIGDGTSHRSRTGHGNTKRDATRFLHPFDRPHGLSGRCPEDRTTENDIVYTKAGGSELKLDLARPAEGDGPFPVVLVIHGGGWRGGNKDDHRPALAEFAQTGLRRGLAAVPVLPQGHLPGAGPRREGRRALGQGARQGVQGRPRTRRRGRVLGRRPPLDDARRDRARRTAWRARPAADAPDSSIQAVVNYFGPTDMTASDIPEVTRPLIKDFLGGTPRRRSPRRRRRRRP